MLSGTAADLAGRDTLSDQDVGIFDALADLLLSTRARRVPLDEVVDVAAAVDPELDIAPDRRARLAGILRALQTAGIARLAGRDRWDRRGTPALPLDVRGPAQERTSTMQPVPGDLRPELAAAAKLERVTVAELDALRKVNSWLRDFDRSRPVVPARERSWEIFGDEKRLDVLTVGRLFREEVLSYELLACEAVHPPFVHQLIGDTSTLLVVENHHSYASLARALLQGGNDRSQGVAGIQTRMSIGTIAYGAGHMFEASVTYAADLSPLPERILYFGDLDAQGLAIPARADQRCRAAGLPGVEPAVRMYEALLEQRCAPSRASVDREQANMLAAWLPAHLRVAAVEVLIAGQRIPQESVGYEQLVELLSDEQ